MSRRTRTLFAALAAVAALASLVIDATPSSAAHHPAVLRVSGSDRYDTAARLSEASFPDGAPAVVVATGADFPDALAGGPLAALIGGPVLLARRDDVPVPTVAELARLGPTDVVVLGGAAAISDAVVAQIGAITGAVPRRLAGDDRYGTAAAVAQEFDSTAGKVYVATGQSFPDALAGGVAAATAGTPVILVRPDSIPSAAVTELTRLQPSEIVVLGGPAAVSDAAAAALGSYAPSIRRLAGADRYVTAAAVAADVFPSPPLVYVASGQRFADALVAGPAAAADGAPLLLAQPTCVPPPMIDYLRVRAWPVMTVLGGLAALDANIDGLAPCVRPADGILGAGVELFTLTLPGPNVARVLVVDRNAGWEVRSVLATGRLTGRLGTSDIARRWGAVAAVNGDFFEPSGRPVHAFATGGRLLQFPSLVERMAATSTAGSFFGEPELSMEAEVVETSETAEVARSNDGAPAADELALYTPEGAGTPPGDVCAARLARTGTPSVAPDGTTTENHTVISAACSLDAPIVGDDVLLVAPSAGTQASFITDLDPSQHVRLAWQAHPSWTGVLDATGGNPLLVVNGAVSQQTNDGVGSFFTEVAPRTAIGALPDGRILLVIVDGRQPGYSVGMNLLTFANFLVGLGAAAAVNVDGGGSTAIAANGLLVNHPSDGSERAVGTALVVVPQGTADPGPLTASFAQPFAVDPIVFDDASYGGWVRSHDQAPPR